MSDLEAVAAEFKRWKGSLSYCRYPSHLWDKAYELRERYPLETIATALGVNALHLKHKFSDRANSITFAPLQVTESPPQSMKISFKQVTLETTHEQVVCVIQALMRNS